MIYSIGDIQIEIASDGEDFLGRKFHSFLSERKDCPSALRISARRANRSPVFDSSEPAPVNVYSKNGKIVIERQDFSGSFDPEAFQASVEITAKYSLESFIRILYSLVLPCMDGLSIHSASLVRNGKAYIFPGTSGAGKTTIARSSSDVTLLSDENSIVRGIGEAPLAYGTPFHGDLEIPGKNVRFPVAGLYFPVKDSENFLERLDTKSALERLLRNVNFFGQDQTLMRKVFSLSYDLVASLPCYDLHFLPDPSFWSCIDEQQGRD